MSALDGSLSTPIVTKRMQCVLRRDSSGFKSDLCILHLQQASIVSSSFHTTSVPRSQTAIMARGKKRDPMDHMAEILRRHASKLAARQASGIAAPQAAKAIPPVCTDEEPTAEHSTTLPALTAYWGLGDPEELKPYLDAIEPHLKRLRADLRHYSTDHPDKSLNPSSFERANAKQLRNANERPTVTYCQPCCRGHSEPPPPRKDRPPKEQFAKCLRDTLTMEAEDSGWERTSTWERDSTLARVHEDHVTGPYAGKKCCEFEGWVTRRVWAAIRYGMGEDVRAELAAAAARAKAADERFWRRERAATKRARKLGRALEAEKRARPEVFGPRAS